MLSLALPGCARSIPESLGDENARPLVSPTSAPFESDTEVQWVKVTQPGVGVMLAAIARPRGTGPFPTLVILHGSHGFARQYVLLARDLARHGVLSVAACWFSGGGGAGSRFVTPIECPEAPPASSASSTTARQAVDALVQAVRGLPDVRRDRVALFGHSRGGGAVLNYVLTTNGVQAAVLNSAGYPHELANRAPNVKVPILILHGTADDPADGGSAMTNVQMARDFEAALHRAGKPVEAMYYEGGHNALFTSAAQYNDAVQRVPAFLARHFSSR